MRILYIAYPLLTVTEESAGGAEQILWTLEREMHARGAHTTVAASSKSSVCGELFCTGQPCQETDDFDRRNREHQQRIVELIRSRAGTDQSFDLVHDMSGSFWPRAAEIDVPVLATLHLPRSFYEERLFCDVPLNVRFNCVSASQAREFADLQVETVVPNGIRLERFAGNELQPRDGLLWLCASVRKKRRIWRWRSHGVRGGPSPWRDRCIRFPIINSTSAAQWFLGCGRCRTPFLFPRLPRRSSAGCWPKRGRC